MEGIISEVHIHSTANQYNRVGKYIGDTTKLFEKFISFTVH